MCKVQTDFWDLQVGVVESDSGGGFMYTGTLGRVGDDLGLCRWRCTVELRFVCATGVGFVCPLGAVSGDLGLLSPIPLSTPYSPV